MIGLIDCNNFFVSCERVRDARLRDVPVVVLSSGGTDGGGCVVALSNEAKQLGIKRSEPYFRIRALCEANGVVALAGTHGLYKSISEKVMGVIREHATDGMEVYSIDEAFIHLDTPVGDLQDYGHYLVDTIAERTGIPVSLGIAPTKTMAKLAARFAKRYAGYRGVCVTDTREKQLKAMSLTAAGDIWGIGPRLSRRLADVGINTALDLYNLSRDQATRLLHKGGTETWEELHGTPCIERHTPPPKHRSISVTRTLTRDEYRLEELTRLVSTYVSAATTSLRKKGYLAGEITVMLRTNRFHTNQPQHNPNITVRMAEPTDYTPDITTAATEALRSIYREGYGYKRAGITLHRLSGKEGRQPTLFTDSTVTEKKQRIMQLMDRVNSAAGGTLRIGATVAPAQGEKSNTKPETTGRTTERNNA